MSALPFLDGVDPPCRSVDPEVFFPSVGEDPSAAQRVCLGCPVRIACAQYAIHRGEQFGVWGGTTGRQRKEARARRALREKLLDERYAAPVLEPAPPDPPELVRARRAVLLGEEA